MPKGAYSQVEQVGSVALTLAVSKAS